MARKLSTREQVMIGVLAVAAVIAYRALSGDGIGFGGPSPAADRESVSFGTPPVVRMDLLDQEAVGFDHAGRNLFAYYTPPRRVAAKPPPAPRPPRRETRRPRKPPPPPPAPPIARAPAPKFQYLGYVGPKDAKIAVFDDGDAMMLAGVGDLVQEDFRLVEFKHDAVMMAYTDDKWKGEMAELKLKGLR